MDDLARRQFEHLERDHWWFRGRRAVYVGLLRHLLAGARPARALDLGAGRGAFASELRELCGSVVALDLDARALAACHAQGRASAVLGDSGRLPFADHSFDLVCLFDVLEHLENDGAALREVHRVLRPGGLCFASVPAWPWLFSGNDRLAHHKRRYTRTALGRCAQSAGLEIVRNTHTNVFLFPLIAPAVLARKAWEALLGTKAQARTNLSWRVPGGLSEMCFRVFAAELVLARWVDLPVGHSIAIAARSTEREEW
jgi:SAM-dependent methyltransferase